MRPELKGFPSGIALVQDTEQLEAFARNRGGALPAGIGRPSNADELSKLVRWANEARRPLVPISSSGGPGRPNDTVPGPAAVIVDLCGMNQMIHADSADEIAVIEPGLTFGDFDDALKEYGLRSFKPLMPRRGKSVLAAYLDREPITSPHDHWDSEDPIGGAELVFGNGERFHTGSAAVKGELAEQLSRGARQKMAVGPGTTDFLRVVQGSQGTLAIVTWAAVYCEPIPALERSFFIGADDLAPVVDLAYRILWRRAGGQLFIVNAAQLAMMFAESKDAFDALRRQLPGWILYVNLTAPDYLPDEKLQYLEADMRADTAAVNLTATDGFGVCRAAAVGEMQSALPRDFYKDRLLGLHDEVFFLTQLDSAPKFVAALEQARPDVVGVYLQPRNQGVSCHFEATFPFDPRDPVSREKSTSAMTAAVRHFAEAGAFFSRPHTSWSHLAFAKDRVIPQYLERVKELFDPNRILHPGRWSAFVGAGEQQANAGRTP